MVNRSVNTVKTLGRHLYQALARRIVEKGAFSPRRDILTLRLTVQETFRYRIRGFGVAEFPQGDV